jgi:hypothetical protein
MYAEETLRKHGEAVSRALALPSTSKGAMNFLQSPFIWGIPAGAFVVVGMLLLWPKEWGG